MNDTNLPLFIDVILPLALNTFTYSVPENLANEVAFGKRVVVQFGKKKIYTALVVRLHHEKPENYETKEITSVLDQRPIVNSRQMEFWQWIAKYYMCTIGEVMKAAIPSGMKLESETKVSLNKDFDNLESIEIDEIPYFELISTKGTISIDELYKLDSKSKVIHIVNSLLTKEAVVISESLMHTYKQRQEDFVCPAFDLNNSQAVDRAFQILNNAPKQQQLFLNFIKLYTEQKKDGEPFSAIAKKKLLNISGESGQILKSLIEKNVLKIIRENVSRLQKTNGKISPIKSLNEHQQTAINQIRECFVQKNICLLHGITGSGKTEIYIHLIDETIRSGRQVLYLLPEIALTAQIINRLKNVFGDKVGIYHSKFSDNERVETWTNICDESNANNYQLVLGVRSSIFLPFSNLGLIIVDEEHETSYKQFDPAPRYNARDAAMILAQMHSAKVLLGTATPAIETYFNAQCGKYGLVNLTKRHREIELPEIEIVNLVDARKRKQMHSHFSSRLLEKIKLALDAKEQIILFQNRRGFSPYLECKTCGHIPKCKYCDVSLTYHKFSNSLVCHYCGYTIYNNGKCEACQSVEMETQGFGTEKIEDDIKIFFPDARVARMDLDTTRAKDAYTSLISQFEKHEIDILIGTQMISKGLDFDNVSLVGILNADSILNMPDFRAFERGFQLMTQVAGRAGRSAKRGSVIIQTSSPQHSVIANVLAHDYQSLFASQIDERQRFKYPPFYRLIRISIKHKDQPIVDSASASLVEGLRNVFGDRILGPEYPPINRIQNLFIKNILIKIEKSASFAQAKDLIAKYIDIVRTTKQFKSINIIINVDPY